MEIHPKRNLYVYWIFRSFIDQLGQEFCIECACNSLCDQNEVATLGLFESLMTTSLSDRSTVAPTAHTQLFKPCILIVSSGDQQSPCLQLPRPNQWGGESVARQHRSHSPSITCRLPGILQPGSQPRRHCAAVSIIGIVASGIIVSKWTKTSRWPIA